MYNYIFGQEEGAGPVRCPIDLYKLKEVDNSYRCRGGRGVEKLYEAAQVAQASAGGNEQNHNFQMVNMLRDIQQTQMMAMRAFFGEHSGRDCGDHGLRRGRSTLELLMCDTPSRKPEGGGGMQRLALTDASQARGSDNPEQPPPAAPLPASRASEPTWQMEPP